MQFQTLFTVLGLAATMVSATPAPAPQGDMVEILSTRDVAINATLTLDAAGCEPLKCVDVVAAAGCIVVSVGAGKPESVLSCIASNADKLCQCLPCIPGVTAFANQHHLCG